MFRFLVSTLVLISASAVAETSAEFSLGGLRATIYVSNTIIGVVYRLTCEVVTSASPAQTTNRTLTLRCEHR